MPPDLTDRQLRAYAIEIAMRCEGSKAVTREVLDAAAEVYAFLKGEDVEPAKGETLN
jgi:hypothetical protein